MRVLLCDDKDRLSCLLPSPVVAVVSSGNEFLRAEAVYDGDPAELGLLLHTSAEGTEWAATEVTQKAMRRVLLFSNEIDDPKLFASRINVGCGEQRAWACITSDAVNRLAKALDTGDPQWLLRSCRQEKALALLSAWWEVGNPALSPIERQKAVERAWRVVDDPQLWHPLDPKYFGEIDQAAEHLDVFCKWLAARRGELLAWAKLEDEG